MSHVEQSVASATPRTLILPFMCSSVDTRQTDIMHQHVRAGQGACSCDRFVFLIHSLTFLAGTIWPIEVEDSCAWASLKGCNLQATFKLQLQRIQGVLIVQMYRQWQNKPILVEASTHALSDMKHVTLEDVTASHLLECTIFVLNLS